MDAGGIRKHFPHEQNRPAHVHHKETAPPTLEELSRQVHKNELAEHKVAKKEEQLLEAQAARFERAHNNPESKRAKADARKAEKHATRAAEGQMCEHGVWRCRICFPHKTGK